MNCLKEKVGNAKGFDRESTKPVSLTTENLYYLKYVKSKKLKTALSRHL